MKGLTFIQPLFVQVINKKKDMTRRIATLPFAIDCDNHKSYEDRAFFGKPTKLIVNEDNNIACKHCNQVGLFEVKPRYKIGEIVYLKEPYMVLSCESTRFGKYVCEIAYLFIKGKRRITIDNEYKGKMNIWKSPRIMPEWASRYKVEVIDISIQNIGDISIEDCQREGVESLVPRIKAKHIKNETPRLALGYSTDTYYRDYTNMNSEAKKNMNGNYKFKSPKDSFITLWNNINGSKPFHSNPHVFTYTFRLC